MSEPWAAAGYILESDGKVIHSFLSKRLVQFAVSLLLFGHCFALGRACGLTGAGRAFTGNPLYP